MDAITATLMDEEGVERAGDIALRMADWSWDAAFVVAVLLYPERFTKEEADAWKSSAFRGNDEMISKITERILLYTACLKIHRDAVSDDLLMRSRGSGLNGFLIRRRSMHLPTLHQIQ